MVVIRLENARARWTQRRAERRAKRGERAQRKAEADAIRLEHRRKGTSSGGDGGAGGM
jgi:hypothetical protein